MTSAPGKPPARAPPARRIFGIAHSSAASTGVVSGRDRSHRGKARFQPQAVARAETDRRNTADLPAACAPAILPADAANADLKAILAGIAGARHHAVDARDRKRAHIHEAHGCDRRSEARQHRFRRGPCSASSARSSRRSMMQLAGQRRAGAPRRPPCGWH